MGGTCDNQPLPFETLLMTLIAQGGNNSRYGICFCAPAPRNASEMLKQRLWQHADLAEGTQRCCTGRRRWLGGASRGQVLQHTCLREREDLHFKFHHYTDAWLNVRLGGTCVPRILRVHRWVSRTSTLARLYMDPSRVNSDGAATRAALGTRPRAGS